MCRRLCRLHLEEHRAGSARRDTTGVAAQQLAKSCCATRDSEVGLGIFQFHRAGAALPCCDLFEQALAHDCRMERTAIEQHKIHARTAPEEIGQVARHRTVGSVGKSPIAQTRLGSIGPRARVAGRKEAIQHQPHDLVARQCYGLCSGHKASPPARERHRELLVCRSDARKGLLLQIAT